MKKKAVVIYSKAQNEKLQHLVGTQTENSSVLKNTKGWIGAGKLFRAAVRTKSEIGSRKANLSRRYISLNVLSDSSTLYSCLEHY